MIIEDNNFYKLDSNYNQEVMTKYYHKIQTIKQIETIYEFLYIISIISFKFGKIEIIIENLKCSKN